MESNQFSKRNTQRNSFLRKQPLQPKSNVVNQMTNLSIDDILPPQGCDFFPSKCTCPPGPPGPQGEQGPAGPEGPPGPESSLCDCCVSPLQNILQQLIGERVILPTSADSPDDPPALYLVRVDEVDDFLVTVTDEVTATTSIVSIAALLGVGFLPGAEIELEPPVDFPGECDCTERPLRQLFNRFIGDTIDVILSEGIVATDYTVRETGLGIVLGELPVDGSPINAAISLCNVIQVNL